MLTTAATAPAPSAAGDRVEAPFLQLVLERLWRATVAAGDAQLTLARLEALGGAQRIVENHLLDALGRLTPASRTSPSDCFRFLVTAVEDEDRPLRRRPRRVDEPPGAGGHGRARQALQRRERAHPARGRARRRHGETTSYELFHDVLAEPILAWRRDFEAELNLQAERKAAQKRQRRLAVIAGGALVALAVLAVLAGWAISERGTARTQARDARARALEAGALQQLTIDPHRSVDVALAGARLEARTGRRNVLRQALVADRLQLVRRATGEIRAVAVSPDGTVVAAASAPNGVLLLDPRTGKVLHRYVVQGSVGELGFADSGRTLVTASGSGFAHLGRRHRPAGDDVAAARGRRRPGRTPPAASLSASGSAP